METILKPCRMQTFANPHLSQAALPGPRQESVLNEQGFQVAWSEITSWPGYGQTPLVSLGGLAKACDIGQLWYKDEAERYGLESFKALGGAYAVGQLLKRLLQRHSSKNLVSSGEFIEGVYADQVRDITVSCATDGNHGRSVAWGASLFGCRCVIYLHETVSQAREDAIASYGAEIVRVPGTYDDAVRKAAQDAERYGRHVVSDTSYPGYMDIPRDVMQGYTVMVEEVLQKLSPAALPTHIFIQGGVGGLAAAVAFHTWQRLGRARPKIIVVEPEKAACLLVSAERGKPTGVEGDLDTIMAGLACGEPSLLAWEILDEAAAFFLTIPDAAAADCMRLLADPPYGDIPVVAGESAVAGLAGLILARQSTKLSAQLGLDANSRVLLFGSEGATDPQIYQEIVGRTAQEVKAA